MEMCTTTMAHRIQVVQTRSGARTCEPAMPLLGMYPEPALCKNLSALLCPCSTLHKSKTGKHTLCPRTDDGIRKRVSMYTRQYDSAIKRRPTPPTNCWTPSATSLLTSTAAAAAQPPSGPQPAPWLPLTSWICHSGGLLGPLNGGHPPWKQGRC